MIPQINVITLVNTVGALSDETFNGNLHMVDNSRGSKTSGLGTDAMCSHVQYAQVINWHVWPVNVQMDAEVSGIRWFKDGQLITNEADEPVAKSKLYGAPSGDYWAAVVDKLHGEYQYQLKIKMAGVEAWMNSFPRIYIGK